MTSEFRVELANVRNWGTAFQTDGVTSKQITSDQCCFNAPESLPHQWSHLSHLQGNI